MQLVTFKERTGKNEIGLIYGDTIVSMRAALEKMLAEKRGIPAGKAKEEAVKQIPDTMLDLIRREDDGVASIEAVAEYLNKNMGELSAGGERIAYSRKGVQIVKPLAVFRALNVGANYNSYLSMMKIVPPLEGTTETFWKLPQAVIGPDEAILWPMSSEQISCEMELGVIIGKKGKRISRDDAFDYIFGYTIVNDVTAIDLVKRGLGEGREGLPGFYYLALAKSMDTFEAIGPVITLKDEIKDPQNLSGEFRINGEARVKGNTSDMRFKIPQIIEYVSRDITLYPGDLIATGAMASEGYAPQLPVSIGDRIEMEMEKIGVLRNHVSAQKP